MNKMSGLASMQPGKQDKAILLNQNGVTVASNPFTTRALPAEKPL